MSKPRQQNTDEQNYQHMERYCFRVLLDYYRLLCRWKEDYAPQTPEDGYHPHFVEALQKLSLIAYLLDELLGGGYAGAGIRCDRIWRGSEET